MLAPIPYAIPALAQVQPIDPTTSHVVSFSIRRPRHPLSGHTVEEHAQGIRQGTHKSLTHEEFYNAYSATDQDFEQISIWAGQQGLEVDTVHSGAALITLVGAVGIINRVFGIELVRVVVAAVDDNAVGRIIEPYITYLGTLQVPPELTDIVTLISGLDHSHELYSRPTARAARALGSSTPVPSTAGYNTPIANPQAVATAYNYPGRNDGTDGIGQVVGLIEPFGSTGWTQANLNSTFAGYGLAVPTVISYTYSSNSFLHPVNDPTNPNSIEVMLDIADIGGIVPKATIVVYITYTTFDAFNAALHDPSNLGYKPRVLSASFAQTSKTYGSLLDQATVLGVTVLCAAGDWGPYNNPVSTVGRSINVPYPAADANSIAVGGTSLALNPDGSRASEAVWNDGYDYGIAGGGFSTTESVPSWQTGYQLKNYSTGVSSTLTGRGSPDVSAVADVANGWPFYYLNTNQVDSANGTSSATPLWAGLIARINEQTGLHQGFITDKLYAHPGAFNDITQGDNNEGGIGYSATSGWDAASGLGTPKGNTILSILPTSKQTSIYWDKTPRTTTPNPQWLNWGLVRSALGAPQTNWGSNGSVKDLSATVTQTLFGKNVDVVVIDFGMPDPGHPEFALSADGTGGSRVQQLDWFQYPNTLGLAPTGSYTYPSTGDSYYNSNGQGTPGDSNHAAAVASIVAGNTLGWAKQANIYAIDVTRLQTTDTVLGMALAFEYVQGFHTAKIANNNTNPTIVICSDQYFYAEVNASSITSVTYRGTTFHPSDFGQTAFTADQLRTAGIMQPYANSPAASLGAPYAYYYGLPQRYDSIDSAVTATIAAGVIVVSIANNFATYIDVPTGQDYNNCITDTNGNTLYYMRGSSPGATPGVICVGNIDSTVTEQMDIYSSRGPRVDIFAPGSDVMIASNGISGSFSNSLYTNPPVVADSRNSSYFLTKDSGTSFAGPQVAGYLACLLEQYPTANQANALSYLTSNAKSGQLTSPAWDSGATPPLPYYVDNNLQGAPNLTLFAQGVATANLLTVDATLSNLSLSQGSLSPGFSSSTLSYTASVVNAISSITVTPTASNAGSTIKVNGTPVSSGSSSGAINLNVGSNTITIVVTASDGTTTKTYTITVTREAIAISSDATLGSLITSTGSFTPAFSAGTTNYTQSVSNSSLDVYVTAVPHNSNATMTVAFNGGTPVTLTSGVASSTHSLNVGSNVVTVVVTAQDGTTSISYTVTITRAAAALSSVATLSALSISSGSLNPGFGSSVTSYTDNLAHSVSSVTVTANPTDSNATLYISAPGVAQPLTAGLASPSVTLTDGSTPINIIVIAQDGTTKIYTINVIRAGAVLSTDASLATLTISAGSLNPSFASNVYSYTDSVANNISSLTVSPTATQSGATITVNGNSVASGQTSNSINLSVGSNTVTITVTAPDGLTTLTYTITVTRASAVSNDASLSSLSISSGSLSPSFNSTTTSYTDSVVNAISSVTVTPVASQSSSVITVNGTPVTSGSASGPISLSVGSNTITISVTAPDTTTTQTYTITVTRANPILSGDNSLSALTVSSGSLSPAFNSSIYQYTDSVGYAIGSVTITATANQANAQISIGGSTISSGSPSNPITLSVGQNTIGITVTAQNGVVQIYTVNVVRASPPLSNDSTLSALSISDGTLNPIFDSNTLLYTDTVDNSVSFVTVTPTASQTNSTIKVNGSSSLSGNVSQPINLTAGASTPISILVTAPDGTSFETYIISVTRSLPTVSSDATLSGLVVSGAVLTPPFSSNVTSYSTIVDYNISSITVTPTHNQANATINVNGTTVPSGSSSGDINLNIGSNYISIVVTAQDGSTTQTYSINVIRSSPILSNDSSLFSLSLSIGSLTPAFSRGTLNYTSEVNQEISSLTITPRVYQSDATVTIQGNSVVSGQPSAPISLNYGDNKINVVVTAQNGSTKSFYIITITRGSPALVPVSYGNSIGHNDFDSIYLGMYEILGFGTNGYGISPRSSSVPLGYPNYSQNWINLYNDLQQCYIHQNGIASSDITPISTGTKITASYVNSFVSLVENLAVDPFKVNANQLSTSNINTIYSSGATWTTQFVYDVVYNWSSNNQLYYFFNQGCSIVPNFTAVGADLSSWQSLINQLNELVYNHSLFLSYQANPYTTTFTSGFNNIVVTVTVGGNKLTVRVEFNTVGTANLLINGSITTNYSNDLTGGVMAPLPQPQLGVGGSISPIPIPVFSFPVNGSKTQIMTLTNGTSSPVTVSSIGLTGYPNYVINPTSFSSIPGNGGQAQFTITYSGSTVGTYTGQLVITSSLGTSTFDTSILVGTSVTISPSTVDTITLTNNQLHTYLFSVSTIGTDATTYTIGLTNTTEFSVSPQGVIDLTQPFTVTFDPTGLPNGSYSTQATVTVGNATATVNINVVLDIPSTRNLGNWISAEAAYNSIIGFSYDIIHGVRCLTIGIGVNTQGQNLDLAYYYNNGITPPLDINELSNVDGVYNTWLEVYRISLTSGVSTYYTADYPPVQNDSFYGTSNTIGSNFGSGSNQGSVCTVTDDGNGNLAINLNSPNNLSHHNYKLDQTLTDLSYSFYYYDELSNRYSQLDLSPINGNQTNYFTGFNSNGVVETSVINANLQRYSGGQIP